MAKSFHDGKITLHAGDCLDVLKAMPENSVDAVCTDPPYHLTSIVKRYSGETPRSNMHDKDRGNIQALQYKRLAKGFMGKVWDGGDIAFRPELWAEVLRVLKPGGHMVAFSGTRTYHRMAVAIEDAGFEIRDQLAWIYGSGFPKSHDVSKGIDQLYGAEREVVGTKQAGMGSGKTFGMLQAEGFNSEAKTDIPITAPATDAARQWQGYGTALKPSWEPICLARKPLSESTVAGNVLRWGTGALDIDATRIPSGTEHMRGTVRGTDNGALSELRGKKDFIATDSPLGRWPANLCHDGSPEVLAAFPESDGGQASGYNWEPSVTDNATRIAKNIKSGMHFGDSGSAARFFYTAKADADDRLGSKHPTVKPVDLMQWLVRLVCPKGGTCLDPFAGTGTTGAASFIEGRRCVLIEREAEYLADIEKRMGMLLSGSEERSWKLAKPEPLEALPLFALPEPAE